MQRLRQALPLLIVLVILAGCSLNMTSIQNLPMQALPTQIAGLTANIDAYVAAYHAEYSLQPRPAADPLGVVEGYLRKYQPGPLPRVFQTTYIYDRNGTRLAELFNEGYRTWVPLSRISPNLIHAIVATEDATFYTNPGFDARRVVGAMMQNAGAGDIVSGASTITMQLARQIFFSPAQRYEQTVDRKVFETLLAQDMTTIYSKDEILEMYLNMVNFGRLAYGAEAAAQIYFAKPASDLNMAEATLLAGIPQRPADYDLYRNFALVKQRQRVVLDLMVRHSYLTATQADAIFAQKVTLNSDGDQPPTLAPHFVQYVTDLMNRRLGDQDLRRVGLRIFTTLDLPMQELAQRVVTEQVKQLRPKYGLSNAALVALKPGTAEILAMVGSADFNDPAIAGQVNVAVRLRQPGSAIKPVLYATAMDENLISPATVLWDVPVTYKTGSVAGVPQEYRPHNYDNTFHGPVTVRMALANSYNIPAVKLLDAVGVAQMLQNARAMGIPSLNRDKSWYGLSLTLGGGEVTLLDLTTAFHTLANGGNEVSPQAIRFTTGDPSGNDIHMSTPKPAPVVSPQTAFLVTSILSDNKARLPAFRSQ